MSDTIVSRICLVDMNENICSKQIVMFVYLFIYLFFVGRSKVMVCQNLFSQWVTDYSFVKDMSPAIIAMMASDK